MWLEKSSASKVLLGVVGYREQEKNHHWVRDYAFDLNGMHTSTHLNVLPLG